MGMRSVLGFLMLLRMIHQLLMLMRERIEGPRVGGRRENLRIESRKEGNLGFTEEVKDKKESRQDDPGNGRKRDRRRFEDKDVKVEEESGDASLGGSNANGGVA